MLGNNVCNDETNHAECNYDGGDCCLSNPIKDNCSECVCSIHGVITSPGFPETYQLRQILTWKIQVPFGKYIEVIFVSFNFGTDNGCSMG